MPSPIEDKELVKRLGNIGYNEWIKLANDKGFLVVTGNRGSHYTNIRDPKFPNDNTTKSLITTLTPNCFKQANIKIFKRFLKAGVSEEEIWKGLGLK